MGVDRLLSAGLDCCIITKAEEEGPGQDRWSGQAWGREGGGAYNFGRRSCAPGVCAGRRCALVTQKARTVTSQ